MDKPLDLPDDHKSLLPKPLSLKSKLSIDTVVAEREGKAIPNTPSEPAAAPPKAFLPYSDSEYSDDDDHDALGLGELKRRRENDDPRKYSHDVDSYLSGSSDSTVKPAKSVVQSATSIPEDIAAEHFL